LYHLYWNAVVNSFSIETPFSELRKQGGCPARLSVSLDYKTYPAFYSWAIAVYNGLWLLGLSMRQVFVISLALVQFSARLLAPSSIDVTTVASMLITTTYNPSNIAGPIDYIPVFDIVSATRVYG
jgi:Protein of unknown function (DUF3433)